MITRGTTPYHNFILPVLAEEIAAIYITYCQNEAVLFEKDLDSEGLAINRRRIKFLSINNPSYSRRYPLIYFLPCCGKEYSDYKYTFINN